MRIMLPEQLRRGRTFGKNTAKTEEIIRKLELKTVCREAKCPNREECWNSGTATFLILGKYCTRNCRFCGVEKGSPLPPDENEPRRIAKAVAELNIKYIVITSVTRDDLPDGGASHFAKVIREIRWENPETKVEVLIPDFQGKTESLQIVLDARPDVLSHNIETVPRLYSKIRPKANYGRSLGIILWSKAINSKIPTKSGLMLGLGEMDREVLEALANLRDVECDFLTLGQYLSPSDKHLLVERFVLPKEFEVWKEIALGRGFKKVASAPLVRSSYLAHKFLE